MNKIDQKILSYINRAIKISTASSEHPLYTWAGAIEIAKIIQREEHYHSANNT